MAGELYQVIFKGAFQPQPFYDSMLNILGTKIHTHEVC